MNVAIKRILSYPRPATTPATRGIPGIPARRTAFLSESGKAVWRRLHFKLGIQDAYFINHPELIKEVLVNNYQHFMKGLALQRAKRLLGEGLLTSEGEFHRRQRRLAQPAFHRARIASYGESMVDYTARMRDRWQDGVTLNVSEEMMRLTLAIVGRTLFDADVESDAPEVGSAMSLVMELFTTITIPFFELLQKLPLPQLRRFEKARAKLDTIIYRMIEERRLSGEDRGDLLSMLLLAQDEEGDGGRMTDAQLRDELMTIFLAGHETTANALTWTWYLLSQNPEAEVRLHAELDEVLGGRLPAVADVPRLIYAEKVLAESMRLYPPAWALGRMTLSDIEIGGYQVPKRSLVLMSQYVMHRDERYFPEPERFDPSVGLRQAREARPQFRFPFWWYPRRCIGKALRGWKDSAAGDDCSKCRCAWFQIVIALRLRITLRPKTACA